MNFLFRAYLLRVLCAVPLCIPIRSHRSTYHSCEHRDQFSKAFYSRPIVDQELDTRIVTSCKNLHLLSLDVLWAIRSDGCSEIISGDTRYSSVNAT